MEKKMGMENLNEFLALLKGVKKLGNGEYEALCPAHNDKKPSLSVRLNQNKILIDCKAGCSPRAVVEALELTMKDLFLAPPQSLGAPVAIYPYHDSNGLLLYEVCRYEPKTFRQRRPDGKGGHIWNLQGIKPVLYHLPDILRAVRGGDTIYIAEGEKDCDNLWNWGLVATTNPQGAGKWKPQYTETLAGANVVILPDTDEQGERHAGEVVEALLPVAKSVKRIGLEGAKDVSDWLEQGHDIAELVELVKSVKPLDPSEYLSNTNTKGWGGDISNPQPQKIRKPSLADTQKIPVNTTDTQNTQNTQIDKAYKDIAYEIDQFLDMAGDLVFTSEQIDRQFNYTTKAEKRYRWQILDRKRLAGDIEQIRLGRYRAIIKELEPMDWQSADPEDAINIKLPLGLEKWLKTPHKTIGIVAGSKGSGKTGFFYDFMLKNMNHPMGVNLFTNDMTPEEVKERMDNAGIAIPKPAPFNVYERDANFDQVIAPDGINIVDYLDLNSELYLIGEELDKIYRKLRRGMALVGIQKNPNSQLGIGGIFSWKRAKWYLSMDTITEAGHLAHKLTIVRARGRVKSESGLPMPNPQGMEFKFDLYGGIKFKQFEVG